MAAQRFIAICTTQRSGSTLVFDDIRNLYGYPIGNCEIIINKIREGTARPPWQQVWSESFDKNRMGDYFIGNFMFHYVHNIADCIVGREGNRKSEKLDFDANRVAAFYDFFKDAIWIHLERRDGCAQAASMHMAQVTKFWTRQVGMPQEHRYDEPAVDYDFQVLSHLYRRFEKEKQQWPKFFRHFGIDPIRLDYDDAVGNYPDYLQPVVDRVELTPRRPAPERRMIKIGGEVSGGLADRLRADLEKERPARAKAGSRIGFVTTEFHGLFRNGGIGTANTSLALALAEAGHEVTVAFVHADAARPRVKDGAFGDLQRHYAAAGITLEYVPPDAAAGKGFEETRAAGYCVYRYLERQEFDIVLFNDCGAHGYYSLAAKHTGGFKTAPRMLVVGHGPLEWVHDLNAVAYFSRNAVALAHLERRCVELADLFVSPSQYLVDWMAARGWTLPAATRVLQNIVSVEPRPAEKSAPGSNAVDEIVFFGRLEVRKGLDLFCDAIDRLEQSVDLRAVRITFMGKFSRVLGLHSGVYVLERTRKWRAATRFIVTYDQQQALDYLGRGRTLAVIPSVAENSPCVVAECLQLGLRFIASGTGGTPELIVPDDRAHCLFEPTPASLADRLRHILTSGQRRGRLATSQAKIKAAWLALITDQAGRATDPPAKPKAKEPPLVSVCLAPAEAGAAARASVASIREQDHPRIELLQPASPGASEPPDELAASNVIAAGARGDYLLFLDPRTVVLAPDCVTAFVEAAERTGADIVTGVPRQLDSSAPRPGRDETIGYLPIGACLELGAFENCFGGGAILVRRACFAAQGGFTPTGDRAFGEWLFLATAVLAGRRLELVPRSVFWQRPVPTCELGRFDAALQHRRILEAYGDRPVSDLRRIAEVLLELTRKDRARLPQLVESYGKEAAELAIRLSTPAELENPESLRGFFQFCLRRARPREALDFVLMNDPALLPEALHEAGDTAKASSLDALRRELPDFRRDVPLTDLIAERVRPVWGLRAAQLGEPNGSIAEHPVLREIAILKAAAAIPPGTASLEVRCDARPAGAAELAVALSRPEDRLTLGDDGALHGNPAGWSGWIAGDANGSGGRIVCEVADPAAGPLDLFLLSRTANGATPPGATVTWRSAAASVSIAGALTPSTIEPETRAVAIPDAVRAGGTLLTDVTGINHVIFRPGPPILLHPVHQKVCLARFPGALPAGAKGVRCSFSVGNRKAHDIEFGFWLRPSSTPAEDEKKLADGSAFSGWIRVGDRFKRHDATLKLPDPAEVEQDLYLGTRVPDQPNVWSCHAYWHELYYLE
ncbi:MAG TPA: DUF6212 domain-containing protein [Stellaceae bacterium]|nr:DUF6212 domain-containing protein [Stellaceae bacterium]